MIFNIESNVQITIDDYSSIDIKSMRHYKRLKRYINHQKVVYFLKLLRFIEIVISSLTPN